MKNVNGNVNLEAAIEQARKNVAPSEKRIAAQPTRLFQSSAPVVDDSHHYHDLHRYETPGTLYAKCGLGERERFAVGSLDPRSAAPRWWAVYDDLEAALETGMLFALVGRYGAGKTVMAAALLWEACRRRMREPKYATAPQFFRDLHASRREDGEGERAVVSKYSRARLLVLDEADKRSNSDYEDRMLWEIIDLRYKRGYDTVMISNLSAEQFAKSLGGAIVDRLRECGGIVACDWDSFRGAKA